MARPRKYVNRYGKPVKTNTGISFNRARNRFYIIPNGGTRQEFHTWDEANAALAAATAGRIPADELARMEAVARTRDDLAHAVLLEDPRYAEIMSTPIFSGPLSPRSVSRAQGVVEFAHSANTLADFLGVPPMKITVDSDAAPVGPRLIDIISTWRVRKAEDGDGTSQHHVEVERRWEKFRRVVGNLFVCQLQPEHFRKFQSWVAREGKSRSAKWSRDQLATVKSVIGYVKRRYPEWPWPAGVMDWASSYHVASYKPASSNRAPMPPDHFAKLLNACRQWASKDVGDVDTSTPSDRGKYAQLLAKRRDGVQLEAILLLGLNAGLDPVDIERMTWHDLFLDRAVPHLKLIRRKVARMIGEGVERITPLLPRTVAAIQRWTAFEGDKQHAVFRTARKGPYKPGILSTAMARLRVDAGLDNTYTFKHLRNVGVTLAKRARLSIDEREAFLGHVVRGTSRFYEGDVDETYLIPLVNLIGVAYFDGETVETP